MLENTVRNGLLFLLCLTATCRGVNLLKDPSFEIRAAGETGAWRWEPGRAKAQLIVDTSRARSGKASVCLKNSTPRAPHVYGQLNQSVQLEVGKTYTLSCYVWTEDGGAVWIGGGRKWQFRFPFPKKTEGWQRVAGTFKADDTTFVVRILSESPTDGVWVDDVQLEPGDAATAFVYAPPLRPGECRLRVNSFEPNENLVPNASFEVVDGIRPKFWMWDRRNTDAEFMLDTSVTHSGRYSARFTNGTAFFPQVYAWFGVVGGIPVKPGRVYTLSAYVRSADAGTAWIGGGQDWRIRLHIPATAGEWKRIQQTFQTRKDEENFPFMIVTESPTPGVWVDDIRLEEGAEATPCLTAAQQQAPQIELSRIPPEINLWRGRRVNTAWMPELYPPTRFLFTGGVVRFRTEAWLPGPPAEVALRIKVTDAAGRVLGEVEKQVQTRGRGLRGDTALHIGDTPNTEIAAEAVLLAKGRVLARQVRSFHVITPAGIRSLLRKVAARRDSLRPLTKQLEAKGGGAYSRVTLTVLDNFIPWVEQDVRSDLADRAWAQAVTLDQMAERELRRTRDILAGKANFLVVPRYRTGPVRIDGPSFIATREFPDGRTEQGPVFFVGYGHFSQVRNDIEKFPGYGCNLIQIEFGPRSVLPTENTVSTTAIDDFLKVCDRAAKANVGVNLLLSPHYFPNWATDKWPWLKDCRGGFFRYCVHAPEARAVLEKSFRTVIPRIKGTPALHSLCLSNEPICTDLTKCRVSKKTWPEWLRTRHGRIDKLNAIWGTHYKRFEDIPVPPPKFTPGPNIYDFVLFNQETFAGFHEWMADAIHAMAPAVPVHAKIMMSAHFGRSLHGAWSVSPELFGELSQINGNDCCCWYRRRGEWANGGPQEAMAYDFQRSMADKPVFNSENHIILDRDHGFVPPEHVYTALWQGALHGQSATTIWVWGRTNSHTSDFAGSILHRPACVAAVGRACLDLNRLAHEMTAFQRQAPRLVFLWSLASVVQGDEHVQALGKAWRAADCLGVPLGLVTERRLKRFASGAAVRPLDSARVVVAAGVTHLSDAVLAGLRRFEKNGGRVVTLGDCFGGDEYGRVRKPKPILGTALNATPDDSAGLFAEFARRLAEWGIMPAVRVLGADRRPVFGIEPRSVGSRGRLLANLCNYLRSPQTVQLQVRGKPVTRARNLITGETVSTPLVLRPLVPVLLDLGQDDRAPARLPGE
ncbi:MAG: hypothetical protein GXP31_10100 [Kiritimatiellaeota bacterium]|nr:hypothetical protein [Kiritimatiellota bacterium]